MHNHFPADPGHSHGAIPVDPGHSHGITMNDRLFGGAPAMRAKLYVTGVVESKDHEGNVMSESLSLCAISGKGTESGYAADGTGDEDNTFSRWTPCASLTMTIQNPALFGKFKAGSKLYVDFTPAP